MEVNSRQEAKQKEYRTLMDRRLSTRRRLGSPDSHVVQRAEKGRRDQLSDKSQSRE